MIDELVERYIKIRDSKKAIKERYDAEVAKLDLAMEKIEAYLLKKMQEQGLESMPTGSGTAYKSIRASATVADKPLFRQFCAANDAWHLADMRASAVEVRKYLEETEDLPPGVNFSQHVVVNVRRS
jgi:hypothetical protein